MTWAIIQVKPLHSGHLRFLKQLSAIVTMCRLSRDSLCFVVAIENTQILLINGTIKQTSSNEGCAVRNVFGKEAYL